MPIKTRFIAAVSVMCLLISAAAGLSDESQGVRTVQESFYAAGVFNDKNPWWPVMPDLALYLRRLSCLLRKGEPVADIALYAPTEDAWSTFRSGAQANVDLYCRTAEWIGPNIIPAIIDAGFNFDLVDEATLLESGGRYKAVVLPGVRWMPEETGRHLAEYARNGGKVLAVRRKPERAWPSLEVVEESRLSDALASAIRPDVVLSPRAPEIGFVHRRMNDGDVYFLANTGNAPRRVDARFRAEWPHTEIWDPFTGKARAVRSSEGLVALDFEPYGSSVVVFRKDPGGAPAGKGLSVLAVEEISAGWNVSFGAALDQRGIDLPHSWADDADTRHFSGVAAYHREVQVRSLYRRPEVRVYLDFGEARPAGREPRPGGRPWAPNIFAALVDPPIRDAATVLVNGERAGTLWCPPYRIDVTGLLRDGPNEFRIEVYNTAINQLADGDRLPDYKSLNERYGQRFSMQDMEDLKPLPSGILSAIRLVAER